MDWIGLRLRMMAVALTEQMSHMYACQVVRQKYVDMQTLVSVMVAKIYYISMHTLFTIFRTSLTSDLPTAS
jgi:hypothetical protein